jgi:predicted nucleic acid-binding protein
LRGRPGAQVALAFLHRVRSDPFVRRVFFPEAWEDDAEHLLEQYDDQAFSYVDAASFVTMRRLRMREALAFDRAFMVAGFTLMSGQ